MRQLNGKVCIVTGGASGIGRALCERLYTLGAHVIVADLRREAAAEVAGALTGGSGTARAAFLDVTNADAFRGLVDEVVATHGRLDLLFNNAGIFVMGEVQSLSLDHFRKVLDVNLMGVIHGTFAVYPTMIRQKSGHIVNVASGFGLAPGPFHAAYCTSKFAVVGFSESLRPEAEAFGVSVSTICPAYVETPLLHQSESVNVDLQKALGLLPFPVLTAQDAAERILRGVVRRQAIVLFPLYAKLLIWMYRLFPGLSHRMNLKNARDFRALGALNRSAAE
jgi:NAD(P)-dependent dehydrogenase (short-subunit alcohol dehydrogenase family)